MRKVYHSAIFYPEDKKELLALSAPLEKKEYSKAVIVPHQDLRKCYKAYQEAFSHIPDNSKIIALLPIHSEKLIKDKASIVFEYDEAEIETPLGMIRLKSLGLERCGYYGEEEYSAELIFPYIITSCPNSTLSVVFAKVENSDECKKLSKLIEKWNNDDTFFIISSNLTGRLKTEELVKEKAKAIQMLESGTKLLDSYRKGHCNICAAPIIDALGRIINGKWALICDVDDTITGHAAFKKEKL